MSERELYIAFPLIFGGTLVLGVGLFAIALFLLRRRRTGGSYRYRRSAGERGGRLFIFSIVLVVLSMVMGFSWLVVGVIYKDQLFPPIDRGEDDLFGVIIPPETLQALTALALTPTATPTYTETPTFTPTITLPPTETPTAPPTNTLTPTLTSTPIPTDTLIPTESPIPTDTPTSTETLVPLMTNTPLPTLVRIRQTPPA